jgi:putative flippase GtrA
LNYILAAGIAYLVAITLHYHTTRHHIFRGTIRTTYTGFAYFLAVGVLGLAVALITMTILIKISGATYLFARLIATIAIIPVTYVSNKYLTFIMPRPLPDEKNLYCNIPG